MQPQIYADNCRCNMIQQNMIMHKQCGAIMAQSKFLPNPHNRYCGIREHSLLWLGIIRTKYWVHSMLGMLHIKPPFSQLGNNIITPVNSLNILTKHHIDGLAEDCSNSIANALELLQSCTKPSIVNSFTNRPKSLTGKTTWLTHQAPEHSGKKFHGNFLTFLGPG